MRADTLARIGGYAPPTLHALGARAVNGISKRIFNLVVTNVPGPQVPLYAAGARLLETYPGGAAGRRPGPRGGDHLLRRRPVLRVHRRPRRAAGRRRARRDGRRGVRRARGRPCARKTAPDARLHPRDLADAAQARGERPARPRGRNGVRAHAEAARVVHGGRRGGAGVRRDERGRAGVAATALGGVRAGGGQPRRRGGSSWPRTSTTSRCVPTSTTARCGSAGRWSCRRSRRCTSTPRTRSSPCARPPAAIDAADLGDLDAEFLIGEAEDHELAWYDPGEVAFLVELG